MADLTNFVIGLLVGLLTCGGILAAFGRFVLKAIIKEVVDEMSKNWVTTFQYAALEGRVQRIEGQLDKESN